MFKVLCLVIISTAVLTLGNTQLLRASEKYSVSTILVEYAQAYAICKKHGLTLATEKTEQEATDITAAVRATGVTNDYYWLGGLNVTEGEFHQDSVWIWLDSGEEFNRTNWKNGEPTSGDNCLMRYSVGESPPAKWASRSCINPCFFICQTL